MKLTDRELAAVLAGLRTVQDMEENLDGFNLADSDIATDAWRFDPLTTDEINALCARLNTASGVEAEIDRICADAKDEAQALLMHLGECEAIDAITNVLVRMGFIVTENECFANPTAGREIVLVYLYEDSTPFLYDVRDLDAFKASIAEWDASGDPKREGFRKFMAERGYREQEYTVAWMD